MARPESRIKAGYLPTEEHHYPAILSLLHPGQPDHKLLDPFAGEGEFLQAAARAWNLTPYANELDRDRAALCAEKFGLERAVRGDVERLSASNAAFSVGWFNPPYDGVSGETKDNRRLEFKYLKHAWKWIVPNGLVFWVVYQTHLTDIALKFFSQNALEATIWGLPGLHQGEYPQVIVAAIKGANPRPDALLTQLEIQRESPCLLTVQGEPPYRLPALPKVAKFYFSPDEIDAATGAQLIAQSGAWAGAGFQALLHTPTPQQIESPVVAPRPGHLALALAGGLADGAVFDSPTYGRVVVRGKTIPVEQVARVEHEADDRDPDRGVTKTTIRRKPVTTLTLLGCDGAVTEMSGDEALIGFITSHQAQLTGYLQQRLKPQYGFDLNGLGGYLGKLRLNGKYPLFPAQQHVVAAILKGFETRKGILFSGTMGSGKTAMGASVALAIGGQVVKGLAGQFRPDQVALVICPPHLIEKWQREVVSLHPNALVKRLDKPESVRQFMDQAAKVGDIAPKIGLIKRDLTKLGSPHTPAIVWKKVHTIHWKRGTPPPNSDLTEAHRVSVTRIPTCPTCGKTAQVSEDGGIASEAWLKAGRRSCLKCHAPLWQLARMGKSGTARQRLDELIQREYRDRVALLVWDEAHEAAHGDTGNGTSFGRLAGVADRVLALTGTPFNGYASSMMNLEYHLNPRVRQRYNWGGADRLERKARGGGFQAIAVSNRRQRGQAEARWVSDMGLLERVITESPQYDATTGAFTGTSSYERPYTEAAGISPFLAGEMLDHTIFLSLEDFGKILPRYEEIAIGVDLDPDVDEVYRETRDELKRYLMQHREAKSGKSSFMGAYLQWSLGWQNVPFIEAKIIHNQRGLDGKVRTHVVKALPTFDADRIYAKEQALIDLLKDELSAGRRCVVYLRQTQKNDLQPRLERLIRENVPNAVPFVLRNTVNAEKREALIDKQLTAGMNVLLCNPELVKTGLDLLLTQTLIFYEITLSLSTMMQAAARAYRLNQRDDCKTVYLFARGTFEQSAVQLMSRKQRAAKLLMGSAGVSGLDALTDGDGGLEEALRDALTADDGLLNARDLFAQPVEAESALTAADLNYWNSPVPLVEAVPAQESGIALLESITALGGTVRTTPTRPKSERIPPKIAKPKADPAPKVSPQRRKRKPDLLDLPDEPARHATTIPAPRIPANAPVQLTLF